MLKEFKQIVANCKNTISDYNGNHTLICEYFNINIKTSYSSSMVTEKIYKLIRSALEPTNNNDIITYNKFRDLEAALVYEAVLYNVNNDECLQVLQVIRDAQKIYTPIENIEKWKDAIIQAKNYIHFRNEKYKRPIHDEYRKEYDTAIAHKKLQELGCEIRLEDTTLTLVSGAEKIVENIENDIKSIGGQYLQNVIFHFLIKNNFYFKQFKLYAVNNRVSFSTRPEPISPIGYLLNLSLKHIHKLEKKIPHKTLEEKLASINTNAKLLSTALALQNYSIWDAQFFAHKPFPQNIQKLALFDSTFTIQSANIDHIIDFISSSFNWVDNNIFAASHNFSISEYIQVTKSIRDIANYKNGSVIIYFSKVKKICSDVNEQTIKTILHIMSHQHDEINTKYQFINDYEECNFSFKPLIEITPTKFLLCDISWCAINFYECLTQLVRNVIDEEAKNTTDNKLGQLLEDFVYKKLTDNNITFSAGDYDDGQKPKGECDVIIESEKAIDIIEIKKKVLKRASKSGNDVELVIDLSSSLLDSQIQTGRTEILLREQGYIDLKNKNGEKTRIYHKNREINRIALTHLDYGSFQDRTIINNILTILNNERLGLRSKDNSKKVKKFEDISKKCDLLSEQSEKLQSLHPGFDHFPFFDCWFLSLQQLLLIIDVSYDNNSFHKALNSTKHVTTGSNNFYTEFSIRFNSLTKETKPTQHKK